MEYRHDGPTRPKHIAETCRLEYRTLIAFGYVGSTHQLLAHQQVDGAAAGSWEPVDEWAEIGGRVYQTAICTLMLEVYYRYLPMYAYEGYE